MSSAEAVRGYLRERFPLSRFAPLALLLAAPGILASASPSSWLHVVAIPLAVLLAVLAFRVADDLADRTHDAASEPWRITVRTASPRPFVGIAGASGTAAVVLFAGAGNAYTRLGVVAAAAVLLAAWYALRRRLGDARLLNAHVVLLKYPLLVIAAAGSSGSPTVVLPTAGLLYVALLIHEVLDDRDLRGRPRALLLAHGVALLILGALLLRAVTLPPVTT